MVSFPHQPSTFRTVFEDVDEVGLEGDVDEDDDPETLISKQLRIPFAISSILVLVLKSYYLYLTPRAFAHPYTRI